MRHIKYLFIIILSIVLCTCAKQEKIKIAIMTKLSSASIVGSSEINAGKLFIEKNNIKDLEIYAYDDQWEPNESIIQFNKMRSDGIDILITSHISGCVIALEEMINNEKVFCFVTGATTDEISGKDDFIFRNVQDVISEQKSMAEFTNKHYNDLLVIRDTDNFAYTEPALKYFLKYQKLNSVHLIDISIANLNLDSLRQEIEVFDFDSLYLLIGGYQVNAGNIAQLVDNIKPKIPILYTAWMKSPTLLETAGQTIKQSIIASHYPPYGENKNIINYLNDYQNKFGELPTYISFNVYSALEIIYEAIRNGNKSPQEIKDFLLEKRVFSTQFGEIIFNNYGDIEASLYFINDILKEFKQ
ncbi:MAG: ABC transporter substrate-binding protein [Candidatus Cloacimonadales bacterium]|jgi:branched-chain amino acid transport system substrate-binding protein|nr:ABC transporter substrate-binding protein [Acholeplasmataceae bacterium]MCK9427971.1 ABC transporter substrate-binding protein [Acholeplasmataceae bacterium]MDD4156409.1 ABC transporter substrate-binding protein [Candidatus Cloacimonadota bacterium]MDX9977685.1 ABC transporter substrate-binding protein [Candidatus Cloacimonadales bacterium]